MKTELESSAPAAPLDIDPVESGSWQPTEPPATSRRGRPVLSVETPALSADAMAFRQERERIVSTSLAASLAAARALREIHDYEGGILWKQEHPTFVEYCRATWGYMRSHTFRLLESGAFLLNLENQSPIGDCPANESQIRPLLALPEKDRVLAWREMVSELGLEMMTAKVVKARTRTYAERNGIEIGRPGKTRSAAPQTPPTAVVHAGEDTTGVAVTVTPTGAGEPVTQLREVTQLLLQVNDAVRGLPVGPEFNFHLGQLLAIIGGVMASPPAPDA